MLRTRLKRPIYDPWILIEYERRNHPEDDLRLYAQCHRKFGYGGKFEFPMGPTLLREMFEAILVAQITGIDLYRKVEGVTALDQLLVSTAFRGEDFKNLLDAQQEQWLRYVRINVAEMLNTLPLQNYMFVTGPEFFSIKISETKFHLRISTIMQNKLTSEVQLVEFSPYSDAHAVSNDPVLLLKLRFLKKLHARGKLKFKPRGDTEKVPSDVSAHVFYLADQAVKLEYLSVKASEVPLAYYRNIKRMVKDLEGARNEPVVPCRFSCEFKSICFPGKR